MKIEKNDKVLEVLWEIKYYTKDHKFLIKNGNWIKAVDLSEDDEYFCGKELGSSIVKESKCECGAESCGCTTHSDWCPKHK